MTRLDHLLSLLAFGSRTQVKMIIHQGRVQVDGRTALDPGLPISTQNQVSVDGQALDTRLERHLMMNKPLGVLTAARDAKQKTVLDLLPDVMRSLECMPIGRLDKDTQGLLLFTTDGQAAHRLLSPKAKVAKVYQARVEGQLTQADIRRFQRGISLSDFDALPAELLILQAKEAESLAQVTVCEGKFHQVRRMFGACGHEVLALERLSFGALTLDPALAPSQWRELSAQEWQQLTQGALIDG